MGNDTKAIPGSVIKRLTAYLSQMQTMRASGVEWISSQELADKLGLTSSTVRQDLLHLDYSGVSKRGYETEGLSGAISTVLGVDKTWNVVVVGAGNLGVAFAMHQDFGRRGFNIRGILDCDSNKIGNKVGALTVKSMADLSVVVKRERIDMGIIAVPAGAAQEVADLLVDAGVSGLLNMALTHIIVSDHVVVVDTRIVASLQELSHLVVSRRAGHIPRRAGIC